MEQAIIVIYGFMGPLILICVIGLIYMIHLDKKEHKKRRRRQ